MMGAAFVRSTIAALVIGVAVNSNKVVKQHDGDQESNPLTLFGSPEWSGPCSLGAKIAFGTKINWGIPFGGWGCSGNQEAW